MGEIPVLEDDGARLTQTAPILLRLAARYDRFQGADETERYEVLRWLFWDNQKLSAFMATYRFLRTFTSGSDPAVLAWLRCRIDDYLGIVEQRVADSKFIIGDLPTIVDLSMCAYVAFPSDETGYDLSASHPGVHAWLQRIAALPGWRAAYDLLPGKRLPRFA
jgi:glutathione S-transferase